MSENDTFEFTIKNFKTHAYIVGSTGSGKSVLIKNILSKFQENEENNHASIYIDVKGADAQEATKAFENDNYKVNYLDIKEFNINPFELPDYTSTDRAHLVELYKGNALSILSSLFDNSKTFLFLNRTFGLVLTYLYQHENKPTLTDVYDIINIIVTNRTNPVQAIENKFGPATEDVRSALENISAKEASAFDSIFNRLEQIETNPALKKMFCQRESNTNIEEIIKPGQYTVFKIGDLHHQI